TASSGMVSPSLVTIASSLVRLRAPVDDELRHVAQELRPFFECRQMAGRAVRNRLGAAPRLIDAQHGDERRLARGLVLPDRLARDRRAALDVQQIVGDLEGEAEIVRVELERPALLRRRARQDGTGLAGEADDGAGLQALQLRDRLQIELGVLCL